MAKISLGKFTNIKFLLMVVGALFVISFVYGMYTVKEAFFTTYYTMDENDASCAAAGSYPVNDTKTYNNCKAYVQKMTMGGKKLYVNSNCKQDSGNLTGDLAISEFCGGTTYSSGSGQKSSFTPTGTLYSTGKLGNGMCTTVSYPSSSYYSTCSGADSCTTGLKSKYGSNLFSDSSCKSPADLSGSSYCNYSGLCTTTDFTNKFNS